MTDLAPDVLKCIPREPCRTPGNAAFTHFLYRICYPSEQTLEARGVSFSGWLVFLGGIIGLGVTAGIWLATENAAAVSTAGFISAAAVGAVFLIRYCLSCYDPLIRIDRGGGTVKARGRIIPLAELVAVQLVQAPTDSDFSSFQINLILTGSPPRQFHLISCGDVIGLRTTARALAKFAAVPLIDDLFEARRVE